MACGEKCEFNPEDQEIIALGYRRGLLGGFTEADGDRLVELADTNDGWFDPFTCGMFLARGWCDKLAYDNGVVSPRDQSE